MNELDRHDAIGCPDAEMLAAWSEGGLRADERSRVEEHAAACGRCQAHLAALVRTARVEPPVVSHTRGFRIWPWLVPAAGAAAAVTIWMIAPPPQPAPPRQLATPVETRDEAEKPAAPPVAVEADRLGTRQTDSPQASSARERKLEALTKERRDAVANEAPAAVPQATAPRAATAAAAQPAPPAVHEEIAQDAVQRRVAAFEVQNLVVHRTPDGRVTWETGSDAISPRLIAGASPSPSVIWLVGKGGLVLRSTDRRSWRSLPFPEAVDLTAVEASSDTHARVTTADARVFTTTDGGATWKRQ